MSTLLEVKMLHTPGSMLHTSGGLNIHTDDEGIRIDIGSVRANNDMVLISLTEDGTLEHVYQIPFKYLWNAAMVALGKEENTIE